MASTSLALGPITSADFLFIKLAVVATLITIAYATVLDIQDYISNREFKAKHGCQPIRQYPLKDPVLGLDFIISNVRAFNEKRLLETLSSHFLSVGYTYSVRGFNRRSIFTAEPENIKTILSLRFNDFALSGRQRIMGPLLGNGIFTTDGDEWAHSRAFLRPYFTKDQLADLSMFEEHIGHLFSVLPRDTSTVDMSVLFHRFTLDSATEFLFGKSTNTLTKARKIDLQFANSLTVSLDHMAFLMASGPLKRFHKNKSSYLEANKVCRAYVEDFVNDAGATKNADTSHRSQGLNEIKPSRYSFLGDIATATNDKDKIRSELLSLLLAGRDTTAALLSSLIHQLTRRPGVWTKLQEEVKQLRGKLPTYGELRNLKYAKYCINEALRLYPPVAVNAKVAVCDTVLPRGGGPEGEAPVFVPKGRKVFYSIYAMQRNKEIYGEDANEFRPERWETLRVTWEYLPFNGGPRACLGQQYALTEVLYTIVRFAQEFEYIEARDDSPWTENLGLIVTPVSVLVGLHRRLPFATDVSRDRYQLD